MERSTHSRGPENLDKPMNEAKKPRPAIMEVKKVLTCLAPGGQHTLQTDGLGFVLHGVYDPSSLGLIEMRRRYQKTHCAKGSRLSTSVQKLRGWRVCTLDESSAAIVQVEESLNQALS